MSGGRSGLSGRRNWIDSLRIVVLAEIVLAGFVWGMGRSASGADPLDWAYWRGPSQDGVSLETGIVTNFNPKGGAKGNLLWKSTAAAGISTPVVMNGRLYTTVHDLPLTPVEGEKIVCIDANTGKEVWTSRHNVFLADVPAERIGWSSCTGDPASGNLYSLGAGCLLKCLDGATGKEIWSRSLLEEYGMLSTYGGRNNTPVVFEDLVIVSGVTTGWDDTARPAHRFLAFDKTTGVLVWITGTKPLPEDTTYSTPFVALVDGQWVLIVGSGDGGIHCIQARTGKILWTQIISRRGVNVSPIVVGNRVYATQGEENPVGTTMGSVVAIDASLSRKGDRIIWKTEEVVAGKSSPLVANGRMYTIDDSAGLFIFDEATGKQIGKPTKLGSSMRGSPIWIDGKIYVCSVSGIASILEPTDDGVKQVFRTRFPTGEDIIGSPIASHGKLYIPTTGGIYCFGTGAPPQASAPTPAAKEPEVASDMKPALLQVIPAEEVVGPPKSQALPVQVRVYNGRGQRLPHKASDIQWVPSQGTVDNQGVFHAAEGKEAHAVKLVAQGFGLEGAGRLRVVPRLPWSFAFSNGEVPITWIGARYRHVPRKVDGEDMIVKITTIPKGTRSQSWMGPTDLREYTIQADMKAGKGNDLPDMGLIAQRYTLDLMGASRQLQIRSWPSQLRMAKSVPMEWEAGVWYTLKFRAAVEGGIAVLRGKVWKRGEPEPKEWTLTADDRSPNLSGSPGLFGNATSAEIFIDNVSVTPN